MNKKEQHTQCLMENSNGWQVTSWIPRVYAEEGRVLKLETDGIWSDGWTVKKVFSTMPSKVIAERGQDYKKTRQASDI